MPLSFYYTILTSISWSSAAFLIYQIRESKKRSRQVQNELNNIIIHLDIFSDKLEYSIEEIHKSLGIKKPEKRSFIKKRKQKNEHDEKSNESGIGIIDTSG